MKRIVNKTLVILYKFCNFVYEFYMRKRLKNKDFSIICSNCIGGVIYHRLGKKFLSPTINLWLSQNDFIKMVLNLREYMNKDLIFVLTENAFPVAMLGDVKIYFNHYSNEEEAKISWEKRKKRINYDNLYLIMYDRDGITREDILKLEEVSYKGKIVLSEKDYPDIEYVKKIKPSGRPGGEQFMDKDIWGLRTFEKQFDYVKWLNR